MLDRKFTKYIFLIVAILNAIFQLSEKPIKYSNWISAIAFLILAIMHLINESKRDK